MLVERGVKDRIIKAVLMSLPVAGQDDQLIYNGGYPRNVRVRQLVGNVYSLDSPSTGVWMVLAVLREGAPVPSMDVPTNAGSPLKDLWPAEANVLWCHYARTYFTGGTSGVVERPVTTFEWFGDGKVIRLAEGDRILMVAKTTTGDASVYFILDLEDIG